MLDGLGRLLRCLERYKPKSEPGRPLLVLTLVAKFFLNGTVSHFLTFFGRKYFPKSNVIKSPSLSTQGMV